MPTPRKPSALNELDGNPSGRPPRNIPKAEKLSKMPPAPRKMGKYAKQLWKKVGPSWVKAGVITDVDLTAWAMLCNSYHRVCTLEDRLGEDYTEVTVAGKRLAVLFTALHREQTLLERWLKEFGMTPVSREKITANKVGDEDEFTQLLKKRAQGQ